MPPPSVFLLIASVVLTVGAIAYTLLVRDSDLPPPDTATGWEYLEQRKARIYDNLRDVQFEYRVGKLSDADYQITKQTLQTELASVLAELDQRTGGAPPPKVKAAPGVECPHCGARFPVAMKFCGSCGKEMA